MELARYLNRTLGTNLAPWDLDDVPEAWIALIVAGSEMRSQLAEQGLIKGQ